LSAIFVDYDNIYLSLKRKNEEAAKRFAKDAATWVKKLETGSLITPTNAPTSEIPRRLVMNRCYGNPVPRRNQNDNSTDMNSFPFVRHHFLRSGFEIVDCPPLTAQLKNSSDIRMVMDIRDYLDHKTNFDEFIILSGDADFTPVLHRLRSHAKRTVIFANEHTATPYTALSDGEVRESDLIALLLGEQLESEQPKALVEVDKASDRKEIVDEVVKVVLEASTPQPLEVLAERVNRVLGHEKTVGTNWAGAGSFRELLLATLPENVKLTEQAPYFAYDVARVVTPSTVRHAPPALPQAAPGAEAEPQRTKPQPALSHEPSAVPPAQAPVTREAIAEASAEPTPAAPAAQPEPAPQVPSAEVIHQQIARIHEACQAPPISPPEYSALFDVLAAEITENQLQGVKTLENVVARGKELGLDIDRDDVRFVLDVVSEADPWFENGASAKLFAGRFRNFVVARCRGQGLNLSADELDLIDAWFAGGPSRTTSSENAGTQKTEKSARATNAQEMPMQQSSPPATAAQQAAPPTIEWPSYGTPEPKPQQHPQPAMAGPGGNAQEMDDFPRIVRNRLRG
jgi:hypothetical protein